MNRDANPESPDRLSRLRPLVLVALALGLLWSVDAIVLRKALLHLIPRIAEAAGYKVRIGEAKAGFFSPIRLNAAEITAPSGTNLKVAEATLDWANPSDWRLSPQTWIKRLDLKGVKGDLVLAPPRAVAESSAPTGAAPRPARLPPVIRVSNSDVRVSGAHCSLDLRGLELSLDEKQTGTLRITSAKGRIGSHERALAELHGVTAWRDGVAYFADLELGADVTIDTLSVSVGRLPAATLEARAFGGYVYADVASDGAAGIKAALNALNLSLASAGAFAGLEGEMEGNVSLAKLTFNGDPARPLSGQISLRIEAGDFAWRKNSVENLTLGLSVAGRRVRINECSLRQKANDVGLRGTISLPAEPGAWREAPFEFSVDADVGNLRALAGLFGPPWNDLSGGLRLEGEGSGKASNGQGWLKVRGWNLTARGVPSGSLQADLKLEGRDLKLTGLDAQSGPNFARGQGQLTLDGSLAYRGRLEMRVREVARYLEPLGRFAPDWAREGGVLLFWDGDGTPSAHSGVATLELVRFTGDLNPVPVNGKISGSYSPGNIYISRILLDRGPLSLSSSIYFGEKGLSVQDMQLFSGRSRLLRAELFLPLSLDAVLARKPWEETVMTDHDIYAFVRSDDLDLGKLTELFGQEAVLRGRADLRLDASGTWEQALVDGNLSIAGLHAAFPSWKIPDSRASLAVQVKERRATVDAQLHPDGSSASVLKADVPLIGKSGNGKWTLVDYASPWSASLGIPTTDVAGFSPKIHGAVLSRGLLRGKLAAGNTPGAPNVHGNLEWKDGRLDLQGKWSAVDEIQAKAVFSGTKAVLEEARARVGGGTLGVAGTVDFADRRNPSWEMLLRGENLLAYEDDVLRLVCRPDLEARGNREAGEIKGVVALDGSSVAKSIALIPKLAVGAPAPIKPPHWADAPFPGWKLDLKLAASAPLAVGRDAVNGTLSPDLYLQGNASAPLLLGTVRAEKLHMSFPSRCQLTVSGRLHFTSEKPWTPVLDLTGSGEAGPFDLRAGVYGPLDEGKLLVSSAPPLTPEQLVVMLTTGVSPVPLDQAEIAPPSTEQKMSSQPSWLDLDKVRGLLGWSTTSSDAAAPGEWSLGREPVGYEWGWK